MSFLIATNADSLISGVWLCQNSRSHCSASSKFFAMCPTILFLLAADLCFKFTACLPHQSESCEDCAAPCPMRQPRSDAERLLPGGHLPLVYSLVPASFLHTTTRVLAYLSLPPGDIRSSAEKSRFPFSRKGSYSLSPNKPPIPIIRLRFGFRHSNFSHDT